MKNPDYFLEVPTMKMADPVVTFLGAAADGLPQTQTVHFTRKDTGHNNWDGF